MNTTEKQEIEAEAGLAPGDPPQGNLKKDSLWMFSGQGLAMAFQAAYFVLIGRALGSGDYGIFVGVASLVSILAQFSTLGMDLIIIRDVSRDRGRFRSSWGLALELTVLGSLVITGIAIAIGHFSLRAGERELIPFVALSDVFLARVALLASKVFQAVGKFALSARIMVLTNITRAIVAGALYLQTLHVHQQATAYMWTRIYWISSLCSALLGVALVTWHLGLPKWQPITLRDFKEGLSFSVSSSSISIYNDIDKTMLVSMGMTRQAGIYAAAYRIVDVASTPLYSIYSAAFPQFFREGAKSVRQASDFSRRLLRKTALLSAALAAGMFFASPLLPLVLGPSFAASASVLRWLCLLPLIRCFHYAAGTTITGSVSQWYRTVQQIAAALLNLLLNFLLIPTYSWKGAAVASLLTDCSLAAMNWVCVSWLIHRQEVRASAAA